MQKTQEGKQVVDMNQMLISMTSRESKYISK